MLCRAWEIWNFLTHCWQNRILHNSLEAFISHARTKVISGTGFRSCLGLWPYRCTCKYIKWRYNPSIEWLSLDQSTKIRKALIEINWNSFWDQHPLSNVQCSVHMLPNHNMMSWWLSWDIVLIVAVCNLRIYLNYSARMSNPKINLPEWKSTHPDYFCNIYSSPTIRQMLRYSLWLVSDPYGQRGGSIFRNVAWGWVTTAGHPHGRK